MGTHPVSLRSGADAIAESPSDCVKAHRPDPSGAEDAFASALRLGLDVRLVTTQIHHRHELNSCFWRVIGHAVHPWSTPVAGFVRADHYSPEGGHGGSRCAAPSRSDHSHSVLAVAQNSHRHIERDPASLPVPTVDALCSNLLTVYSDGPPKQAETR